MKYFQFRVMWVSPVQATSQTSLCPEPWITTARVVALDVFALGAKKQVGHIYLTVEAPGYEFVVELPVTKESDARAFAAKINNASKQSLSACADWP